MHFIAFGNQNFSYGFAFILVDLIGFLRLHNAGITWICPCVKPYNSGNGVDINRSGAGQGDQILQPEKPKAEGRNSNGKTDGNDDDRLFFMLHSA